MSHFSENEFFTERDLKTPWDHPDNFHPAGGLPRDSVLVVRTSALRSLQTRVAELEESARPLERRERTTLLVMLAALAKLARIDLSRPSSAAVAIESQTMLMGARVAARTIETHLKRVPGAVESRGGD
jgi:hypothetical protein